MSLLDVVKWLLPAPNLPQKRYLVAAGLIIYAGLHNYVQLTETDWDNKALEAAKIIASQYMVQATPPNINQG